MFTFKGVVIGQPGDGGQVGNHREGAIHKTCDSHFLSRVIPCQTTRQKLQHQKNVFFGLISVTYILNCQIRLFISVLLGLTVNFSQILSF